MLSMMLIFAGVGMFGFFVLLILWLWILPDRENAPKWWLRTAWAVTLIGLIGSCAASVWK